MSNIKDVSSEAKSLETVVVTESPDFIARISARQDKLFAHIIADELTYFKPENEQKKWRIAESGNYEILDLDFVIPVLERFFYIRDNPLDAMIQQLVPPSLEIGLNRVITPKGETVFVVRRKVSGGLPDMAKIPFTRVIVQSGPDNSKDVAESSKPKRTRRDVISSMIYEYLDECAEKKIRPSHDGCWRHLEHSPNVIDFWDDKITYKTREEKEKSLNRKQLSDRLIRAIDSQ